MRQFKILFPIFLFTILFSSLTTACLAKNNAGKLMPQVDLTPINAQASAVKSATSCAQSQCVVIFMAPWCPRCEEMKRILPELATKLLQKNIGVTIVIGFEPDAAKTEAFTKNVALPVFYDKTDALFGALKIDGVPYTLLYSTDKKISSDFYGAALSAPEALSELGL